MSTVTTTAITHKSNLNITLLILITFFPLDEHLQIVLSFLQILHTVFALISAYIFDNDTFYVANPVCGDEVNRLDLEKLDLHQRVRQGYLDLAQAEPERIKLIDASQDFEDVVEQAWNVIKGYL